MPAVAATAVRLSWNPALGGADGSANLTRSRLTVVSDVDDLVERCRSGDAAAFRELFRQHRNDVARLVHRMLGPSSDVEDVIQEVFLQVHRSVRDFRGQARFSTWLYRVTVNVVLMHRRAARSRPVFSEVPEGFSIPDARSLPDDQVARRARMRAFERLLERLSDKKRTVFILHEIEGMAPADIAEIVGAPVLTVRTRLFYARRELAEMLREEPTLSALADDMASPRQKSNRRQPRNKEAT